MARQRDLIRMSNSEVSAFLNESKTLVLGTINKDGAPHLTALWFAQHDGSILFETYGSSQKVLNLRRDPRVTVLCEAGEAYSDLRGVSIRGRAEVVADGPRLAELMAIVVERNIPGVDQTTLEQHVRAMTQKRVVVVVKPEKTISWDHRKLPAR